VNTFYLGYVRIHGIYEVNQAEYGIRILVVAPHEYVNIYSTCRAATLHVEYAERGIKYGILFRFSPFPEHNHLECEHGPVEKRVH